MLTTFNTTVRNQTHWRNPAALLATSGLASVGVILNVIVIIRMISQGLRRSHFSKIYYISLAITDLVMAACSLGYALKCALKDHNIVILHKGSMVWMGAAGVAWLAITSNLFHVIAITVDRFIATTFPFTYKAQLSRGRVTIGICCIWVISAILVISVVKDHRIALCFAGIGIPIGCFGVMMTYSRIVFIAIKRRRLQRTGSNQNQGPIVPDDVISSINTIFLGLSITITYIVCNIPLSVVFINYLLHDEYPTNWIGSLHALITANAVLDPAFYTLFDVIRLKIKKREAVAAKESTLTTSRKEVH